MSRAPARPDQTWHDTAVMSGFMILVLMVEQNMSRNGIIIGFPGWLQVRSASFFEPDPSGGVLGPSLAGKRPKISQH